MTVRHSYLPACDTLLKIWVTNKWSEVTLLPETELSLPNTLQVFRKESVKCECIRALRVLYLFKKKGEGQNPG